MKKACILLLALAVICAVPLLYSRWGKTDSAENNLPAAKVSSAQNSDQTPVLFPDFDAAHVTAITLTTPQARFDLRCHDGLAVSINGQRGDKDVFFTLLDHIAAIDFIPTSAFDAQETPLLTLTIRTSGTDESVITFYDDDAQGEHARLVASSGNGARYGLTDGWRVGTLMVACEGMRIQDEAGQEAPLNAH